MIELVDLILNVSRVEVGILAVRPETVAVDTVLDSTAENLAVLMENKAIKLEKTYQKVPSLYTDAKLVGIVLQNLISNAIKYTPEGGVIRLALSGEGSNVRVTVSDTGYGISDEEKGKIFTKLFRAENAQKIDPGGSGLGLYLSKEILKVLNGDISFESELGKGTAFTIVLGSMKQE